MKYLLIIALLPFTNLFFGSKHTKTISTIDFVKIKDNRQPEAIFFYKNNWKIFRDIAIKEGYIKSYNILTTIADSKANFDLILITEFADSSQLKLSEERFAQIIKSIRNNGPKLLNELKPKDFREMAFYKQTTTLFNSDNGDY